MAEFIQQSYEEMLPELEEMTRVGFTCAETRAIMKKRENLEYKLRRRTKEKKCFVQYIQYEVDVLELVRKRRGLGHSSKWVEIAIVKRIHKLFKLAVLRFQNDEKLWLSHINFAKKRKEKATVGRLYSQMLQVHNRKPDLWIAAAAWEMEQNLSMENSRGLLQRALQFNPQSRKLWLEYFRMELLYADKLVRRKQTLGLAGTEKEESENYDVTLQGNIAIVVYKEAIIAIPDKIEFRVAFLPIVRLFPFAGGVGSFISEDIFHRFPDKELTWHALATQSLYPQPPAGKKKEMKEEEVRAVETECFEKFEDAVRAVPSEKMWTLYIQTCVERISIKSRRSVNEYAVSRALWVCKRACEENKLSEDMAIKWIELLKETGEVEKLGHVTQTLVENRHPCSVALWVSRLNYLTLVSGTDGQNSQEFYPQLQQALNRVNDKDSLPLWELGLQWCTVCAPDKTETLIQQGISRCAKVSIAMKEYYLDWCMLHKGLRYTSTLFKRLRSSKPLSLQFFLKYITMLKSQPDLKIKKLRKVYESAVAEYGSSNTELWLDYIRLELTPLWGSARNTATLHWRAIKALEGELNAQFVTQYTLLQNEIS